jgi:alpha-tubulin suppressor-like RCC1 family protein
MLAGAGLLAGLAACGDATTRVIPAAPAVVWVATDGGRSHTVARRADGSLWAWGGNIHGQVGNGYNSVQSSPVAVAAGRWAAVRAGGGHALALAGDGSLWVWGYNALGSLGNGSVSDQWTPLALPGGGVWSALAPGDLHTLALRADGSLWAWGYNLGGQLGVATAGTCLNPASGTQEACSQTPMQVAPGSLWKAAAGGGAHSVGIQADGSLWAWGGNAMGQINGGGANQGAPQRLGTSTAWAAVSAGGAHTLALQTDGSLWTWGGNPAGQLGYPTTATCGGSPCNPVPKQVAPGTTWRAAAAGGNFSAAILSDGTLWTWGRGVLGEVGDGGAANRPSPVRVGTRADWIAVAAGFAHGLAVRADGSLWAWGWNRDNQLGATSLDVCHDPAAPPGTGEPCALAPVRVQ